jgi:hypothetical protein
MPLKAWAAAVASTGLPPGKNIGLELGRNLDGVDDTLRIHRGVDFRGFQLYRRLERGRRQAIRDAA